MSKMTMNQVSDMIDSDADPSVIHGKGEKGGKCNITRCSNVGADHFNKSTRAYYCKPCADEINWPGGRADTMRLYGVPLLCEPDKRTTVKENS